MLRFSVPLLLALGCSNTAPPQPTTAGPPAPSAEDRDASPVAPGAMAGCWKVDADALKTTNEIPDRLAPDRFDEMLAGFGLHFADDSMRLWLETEPAQMHFVLEFPAAMEFEGQEVRVQLTKPAGFPDDPVARIEGGLAPFAVHEHTPTITFKRVATGAVESKTNFLLLPLWGESYGPLRLLETACPEPLPVPF